MSRLDWQERAGCRGMDPNLWFPGQFDPLSETQAKRVCKEQCPVRQECLEYALTLGSNCPGIWGGTTEYERDKMKYDYRKVDNNVKG